MALKPRMSVQLPMNLLIYQNSKVKVSLWKNTIILVNGAALTRNILFSRLDLLTKDALQNAPIKTSEVWSPKGFPSLAICFILKKYITYITVLETDYL